MKKLFVLWICLLCWISGWASSEWKAHWISPQPQSTPNTWLAYRKNVTLENVPQTLKARIAVDSKYWLWINGKMVVFEGGLKRGPSPVSTYYDVVDIAPFMKKGENTIAVLVWYFGKNGFSHFSSGTAAMIFEAIAPGVEILSDRTWNATVHPAYGDTEAPHPNFRLSESNILFNANKDIDGWQMPDYKGNMGMADEIDITACAAMGELVERPIPLWKDYGLKPYINVRSSSRGDTLYCRLPYNAQVTPYLKVDASGGEKIQIQTDDYMGGSAPSVRAVYIARKGVQEYESYGWMNGNEMWYIIPEGVKVLEVKYRETGYNTEFTGSFECDDPFYNELWKRSIRTLYITMRDTYMDCPDRERAQWWGDEVNELGEAFYAFSPSSHKLALKGIRELMNWQREDGTIFAPVPAGNWARELPLQMLASVGWYGFHTQYYYSGDSSFIEPVYNRMHRYLHDVWKVDDNGLAIVRHGEWSWGDWGENIDLHLLSNSWYYLALKAEKEFAMKSGHTDDVPQISAMMDKLARNFDSYFWTGSEYRSPDYKGATDDRSQAMAILSGLASADKYSKLLDVFKKEYHASPYMEKYVLEALFYMGEPDFALERMKRRYEKMLTYKDYTTLFEGWGIGQQGFGGGTINHAWSGGPLTLLSQKVCGIEPSAPGFQTFDVSPQMGTIKFCSATVDTHYGLIKVQLSKKNRHKAELKLVVPKGTTASVPVSAKKHRVLSAGEHHLNVYLE